MNDGIANTKITGKIMYQGVDINAPQVDVYEMRKRIGMVFNVLIRSASRFMTILHLL